MRVELPAKILIVRLGAIGDVVNALVLASALEAADPEVEIGWAVHDLARPLVEGHPSVDRVHLWPRARGWRGFLDVLGEIRAERYALAIDLQRIAKSALLARWSGAPRVLGFDRARAKEASWIWTRERIAPGDPASHMVEQYLEFARHLGVADPRPVRRLPRDPAAERRAEEILRELGDVSSSVPGVPSVSGAPIVPIVIGVGATKPANRWLPERFGELARACRAELGLPVCLTGGGADREAGEIASRAAGGLALDLVGRTSLPELQALLARARLFVGCDTGPMHLAAALGTPVVALFGPADPRRTGPYGEGHRVVRVPPPCAPCNRTRCNAPRPACMEDITVEMALEAVRDALAQAAPQARSVARAAPGGAW